MPLVLVAILALLPTFTTAQAIPGLPGQPQAETQAPAPETAPATQEPASPDPGRDLTEIRARLERTVGLVRSVTQRSGPSRTIEDIARDLPAFGDTVRILRTSSHESGTEASPVLMRLLLRTLAAASGRLERWQARLVMPSESIEEALAALHQESSGLDAAEARVAAEGIPQDVRDALDRVGTLIDDAEQAARTRQLELVRLQAVISALAIEIDQTMDALRPRAEEPQVSVFRLDAPPLWQFRAAAVAPSAPSAPDPGLERLAAQADEPSSATAGAFRFILGVLVASIVQEIGLYLAFVLLFLLLRRLAALWATAERPAVRTLAVVVRRPYAAALIPTALVSAAWSGTIELDSVLLLLPLLRIVPHLLPPGYGGGVWLLSAIVLVDLATGIRGALSLTTRVLELGLMAATIAGLIWLDRRMRAREAGGRVRRLAMTGIRVAVAVVVVALVSEIVGATSLARYLEHGVTSVLFGAVLLYAFVQICHGLLQLLIEPAPASFASMLPEPPADLARRLDTGILRLTMVFFVLLAIQAFELTAPMMNGLQAVMAQQVALGAIEFTVGSIVVLVAVIVVTVLVSRVLQFFLSAAYARLTVQHGTGVVISKLVHYSLISAGTLLALGAAGIDLNRFTVLMGALGVGIGFGLQNIVSNFVSGLILLFERPLNVGDNVTVGEVSGRVVDVGIRGTLIHTWEGADVTVPNSNLVSNEFTNWSLSDDRRRSDLSVGVAYGTDPARVTAILGEVAGGVQGVLPDPPPVILFRKFGDSSLDFVIRYWTLVDEFVTVGSDLHRAVCDRLAAEGIEIPFPQRDVHLKTANVSPPGGLDSRDGTDR